MTTPTRPLPMATPARRARSLRAFLRPYRGTLTLASGLTLVETLLDLARPWPLKLAVDNAIGGGRSADPWRRSTSSGRRGWRRWPRGPGSGWSGWGR